MTWDGSGKLTLLRVFVALAIGFAGCCLIWIITPYNNYVLRLAPISGSYLPIGALAVILGLILFVNPLLHWWGAGRILRPRQLILILGMMLVASVIPGQGLLGVLPYGLARVAAKRNSSPRLAKAHAAADLPASLFPDPLAPGTTAKASESFLKELLPG